MAEQHIKRENIPSIVPSKSDINPILTEIQIKKERSPSPEPAGSTIDDTIVSEQIKIEICTSPASIKDEIKIETSTQKIKRKNCTASTQSEGPAKKKIKPNARKYNSAFLLYGFTKHGDGKGPQAKCAICHMIYTNNSLKASVFKKHLHSKHPTFKDKGIEFFKQYVNETSMIENQAVQENTTEFKKTFLLKASYLIASRIAKCKASYTIGETLIKPAILETLELKFGKNSEITNNFSGLAISRQTISRCIKELSADIECQLIERLKQCKMFALQIAESTDVSNRAVLIGCVRYVYDDKILEDILNVWLLSTPMAGSESFRILNEYFIKNDINWKWVVGLCTNEIPSTTSKHLELASKVSTVVNSDLQIIHCMILREALASKNLASELESVFHDCIRIGYTLKSDASNNITFTKICNDLVIKNRKFTADTEIRWLYHGKILPQILDLKNEIKSFLQTNPKFNELLQLINNSNWVLKLCYLVDIFEELDELTMSIRAPLLTIFRCTEIIDVFKKKIITWQKNIADGTFTMFSRLASIGNVLNLNDYPHIIEIILSHLKILENDFNQNFPLEKESLAGFLWIVDPFVHYDNMENNLSLSPGLQDKLTELSYDLTLQQYFKNQSLDVFWINISNDFKKYKELAEIAIKKLLPFCTTFLCEQSFSNVANIKVKERCHVQLEPPMRVSISNISPRIDKLVDSKFNNCMNIKAKNIFAKKDL